MNPDSHSSRTTAEGGAKELTDLHVPPDTRTPRDALMEKQEPDTDSEREMIIRVETLRGFFAYCLAGVDNQPLRVMGRFYAAAYTIRPDLINGATQRDLAELIGIDKSTFNYLIINRLDKMGIKARVHKSDAGRRKLSEAKRRKHTPSQQP